MNRAEEELRKLLLQVTANDVLFPAVVISVDYDEDICDVNADGDYTDVKLRSVIDSLGNRIVAYPKIDSIVLCGRITNSNTIYIIQVGEIDKIVIVIGNTKVVLDENGIVFNNGLNTISKADVLKTELEKMSNRIDGIISAIKGGIPATGAADGGSALLGTIITGLETILEKEDFGDIEDDKIKH